ncbi:uncharacterized protein PRCAT00003042001 [Priceomyces carsonii]|uniref:uncharacterized protein n=1 Tax=Priceomyces carsonii TaxID=28549 RepID=UPI002EDA935F|nr:unnamed protein product [Priceomyces carsonii]
MALLSRVLHQDKPHHHYEKNGENLTVSPFTLTIKIESPPVILYGTREESTGFILSGLLFLDILKEKNAELESVTLSLIQTMKYTKPFIAPSSTISGCKNCSVKKSTLARWDVLTTKTMFAVGSHAYPFSHLLPGSLPATSKLGSSHSGSYIKYDLIATAKATNFDKEIEVLLPLNVTRLVLRGPDRNSVRVFPSTEVSAKAVLPNVVYPKSTFPIELCLDHVVNEKGDRRWRMRKATWRIEESIKIKANACPSHISKLKSLEASEKKAERSHGPIQKPIPQHHSTIQTSMTLSTYPGMQSQNQNPNEALDHQEVEDEHIPPAEEIDDPIADFIRGANNLSISQRIPTPQQPAVNTTEEHLYLEETRTISHGEIKSGWKSDFSNTGRIELVADINASNFSTGSVTNVNKRSSEDPKIDEEKEGLKNGSNVACDIDDPNLGAFVDHTLIYELILVEEAIQRGNEKRSLKKVGESPLLSPVNSQSSTLSSATPPSRAKVGTPTGTARVFRMQFKIILTERSGLGIAWDDEVPPTYDVVSNLSPPTYMESSDIGTPEYTPNLTPSTSLTSSSQGGELAQTPRVIYGVGSSDSSGGLFSSRVIPSLSIDHLVGLDESADELSNHEHE